MTHQQTRAFWKAMDWTLNNTKLARLAGRTASNARRWRTKLGQPNAPRIYSHNAPKLATYAALDWTKQDSTLARELSFSREYIRQLRLKLNQPQSPNHNRKPKQHEHHVTSIQHRH